MGKIAEMLDNINCELDDAHRYATMAVGYKAEDKDLCDVYTSIATNKIANVNNLHTIFNKKANTAFVGASEELKDIWKHEEEKITKKSAEVKSIIDWTKKP